ncbi:phosphotriesterase [Escherichia coli]|nr:phosphotriesterase [Escherichia coli]
MLMSDFKFWGWDEKPRTKLRFIKPGDIFCFKLDNNKYGFGSIVSKVSIGHSAVIFDYFSSSPCVDESILDMVNVTFSLILDSYSLFDKKISGEWRVIGHGDFLKTFEDTYFVYGAIGERKKVDMLGNVSYISNEESENYPPYMPKNDFHVKNMLSI